MEDISFPTQHVSIRVPWHDNGWTGTVCKKPRFNTACLKLKGISDSKDEEAEEKVAGKTIVDLLDEGARLPPCVRCCLKNQPVSTEPGKLLFAVSA